MPFRSPKMYSFIFGFQRFVWWPKCTPASSRSFIAIAAKCPPLLGPACKPDSYQPYRLLNWKRLRAPAIPYFLRSLARASRVSRPSSFSRLRSSALYSTSARAMPSRTRARLARHAAAGHGRQDVELVGGFGQQQRPANLRAQRFGREERVERPVVDADGPGAGAEKHAGGGCLAAPGSVVLH